MTVLLSDMAVLAGNLGDAVQEMLDLFNEQIRVARLDDNPIEPRLASAIELAKMRVTRRGNQRDVPSLGICSQLSGYIEAGDARQLEVENDEIRQQLLSLGQRLGAVAGRRDAIPHRTEVKHPDIEGIRVVVDDQNVLAVHHHYTSVHVPYFKLHAKQMSATLSGMQPNLAQVLNTLAHEIRTPLAVSQGYIKLFLDGRLTNAEDTRKAFEQTRQALGALATLCVDMGKVSALSESRALPGVPSRVTTSEFVSQLQGAAEIAGAAWQGAPADGTIETTQHRELAQAIAIVSKAAFDEQRDAPHVVRAESNNDLIVLAGAQDAIPALHQGPGAPGAGMMDFAKGGKGLKLIWAAFVLDLHRVQTWTHADHRASVGFRIPLVNA